MQKYTISLLILIAVAMFTITGCKKDDSTTNGGNGGGGTVTGNGSVTLNGSGFNNKVINFSMGTCGYVPSSTSTAVILFGSSNTDSLYVDVVFPGNATGTFPWSTNSQTNLSAVVMTWSTTQEFVGIPGAGTTTVTKVEGVGGKITGNFSGKFLHYVGANVDTVSASGSFSAIRVPDGQ